MATTNLAPHGTWMRYKQGCHGEHCGGACRRVNMRKIKEYRLRRATGRRSAYDWLPADFAFDQVREWARQGFAVTEIVAATGLSDAQVRRIVTPGYRQRFVHRKTDEAVRAVAANGGLRLALFERRREACAADRLKVLRVLINSATQREAAEKTGIEPSLVSRYAREAGLTPLMDWDLAGDWRPTRAGWRRRHEIGAAIDRYLSGTATAFEVAQSLGMMTGRYWNKATSKRRAA